MEGKAIGGRLSLFDRPLLAAESEPDEVQSPAHSYQDANEGQVGGVEEFICKVSDPAPEDQARE